MAVMTHTCFSYPFVGALFIRHTQSFPSISLPCSLSSRLCGWYSTERGGVRGVRQ